MTYRSSVWPILWTVLALLCAARVSQLGVVNSVSLTGQETFNWIVLPALLWAGAGVNFCAGSILAEEGMSSRATAVFTFLCGFSMMLGTYLVVREEPTSFPHLDLALTFLFCAVFLPKFFGIVCRTKEEEMVLE